jgi:hypothetical protein
MLEHLSGDVTRNGHDGSVTRLGLGKFSDCLVAKIVKAEPFKGTLQASDTRLTSHADLAWILE